MNVNRLPATLIAGDSLRLAIAVGKYNQADGWSVALVLQPLAGGSPATVAAIVADNEWLMVLSSAASAQLAPGKVQYLIAATKDGNRSTIDHGQIVVLPDPAAANVDQRSYAQRALDAIDAVLERRASAEEMEFTFADGRAVKMFSPVDLLTLRKHYARLVSRENSKGRGPRRVLMRL